MILKNLIKSVIKNTLSLVGPQCWPNSFGRFPILMYHRILPPEHKTINYEQPGMYVYTDTFKMHIRLLKKHFNIIPLQNIIHSLRNNKPLPSKSCAITFDDGWYDNYKYAFPILKKENIPATIFLVSDLIGTNKLFWPERLAYIIKYSHAHAPELWKKAAFSWLRTLTNIDDISNLNIGINFIDLSINLAKKYSDIKLNILIDDMFNLAKQPLNPSEQFLLNWKQIELMQDTGLIDFGSHTRNHVRLTPSVNHKLLADEIITSKLIIEKNINKPVNLFCYPNGDYTPDALNIIKVHYDAAITTQRGWNKTSSNRYLLKRIGIHQDISNTETDFLAKLSGWI